MKWNAFRQILTYQAIGILITATFPRWIWMRKVDLWTTNLKAQHWELTAIIKRDGIENISAIAINDFGQLLRQVEAWKLGVFTACSQTEWDALWAS